MSLVLTPLLKIPLICHGDDLVDTLLKGLTATDISLNDNDILIIAQKIVSKSEGRTESLSGIAPSRAAVELASKTGKDARLVEFILQESSEILRAHSDTIIAEHKVGFVCSNAGIDQSNVADENVDGDDLILLLPRDPDRSAHNIRKEIELLTGRQIGVMIIDSHGRPWRKGTVGTCIGISGVPALVDLRGQRDLFGGVLHGTQVGVGDELAGAASLVMGQAAEGYPVIHARGFPYPLRESTLKELLRPKEKDLFR